jgi:hypothetical protein
MDAANGNATWNTTPSDFPESLITLDLQICKQEEDWRARRE